MKTKGHEMMIWAACQWCRRPLSDWSGRSIGAVNRWLLVALCSLAAVALPGCGPRQAEMDAHHAAAERAAQDEHRQVEPAGAQRDSAEPATQSKTPRPADERPDSNQPPDEPPNDSPAASETAPPEPWQQWPLPRLALAITGNQYGYIEPCGCTGLENQKGGLARRMTFYDQVRDAGWPLLPINAGNQVRRFGRQPEIKFQSTAQGLQQMGYQAVGFGPDDLRLGVGELVAVAAADDPQQGMFVSANVTLIDPSLTAQSKLIEAGGMKVGVTSVLEPKTVPADVGSEVELADPQPAVRAALKTLQQQQSDFRILMYFGDEAAAKELVRAVDGFDLLVVSGGYGEPYYQPQEVPDSDTLMVVTGDKGMYASLVALYPEQPLRYARVAMTHEFGDAPEMRQLMASYQQQLEALGLDGLGLRPVPHPSGDRFVGSQVCGECHTTAYDIWEGTPHHHATDSIVEPPDDRGDVARHFDPECLSCHVTGWHPQHYYPYESGYLSLSQGTQLTGNGCENCHGPGQRHVQAERGEVDVDEAALVKLRDAMRLPLDKARETCLQCHDLDNSPDFHEEGAFEVYWEVVEHYGLD